MENRTKICSKCLVDKDIGEFYKDNSLKAGFKSQCKPCSANKIDIKLGGTKPCGKCKTELEINKENYYFSNGHPTSWCKNCNKSRVKTPENARKYLLEKRFDISVEQYEKILQDQGGVCKICKNPETRKFNGKTTSLSVDHCHKNGKIRGILCDKCNNGLARFRDNCEYLRSAIIYLCEFDAESQPEQYLDWD
jgi:hypothetical protein